MMFQHDEGKQAPASGAAHAGQACTDQLQIIRPDDWHLHLRDGSLLQAVIADTARQFSRAIIMPNLKPPVTTVTKAKEYRERIVRALASLGLTEDDFRPLMTLYLTDNTSADEIRRAHDSGIIHGVKLYPAGATTHSDAGVTDLLRHCSQALECMQDCGMPLLMHGESTDSDLDIFDREEAFIDRVLQPLRQAFPGLKMVLEHLTTAEGAAYVQQAEGPIAATITAHHLLYNRNAMFQGGLQPHWYCLPVLKREKHRQALLAAASSGNPRFFLGTDSAPHPRTDKESACGCAGCYTAWHAMALYATAFDEVDALDKLEAFASLHGPKFYGLTPNTDTITLERCETEIPASFDMAGQEIIPLAAGQRLAWRLA